MRENVIESDYFSKPICFNMMHKKNRGVTAARYL